MTIAKDAVPVRHEDLCTHMIVIQHRIAHPDMRLRSYLFALLVCSQAHAVTLRVPTEYLSIQAALDACAEHDTIVVESGVYSEALLAPPYSFVLMGAQDQDSLRPVVDPAMLENPHQQRCLLVTGGVCDISNLVFRNSSLMHPHASDSVGGVECLSDSIRFANCLFDSCHIGLWSEVGTYAELTSCRFIAATRHAIRFLYPGTVRATDCEFRGDSLDWACVNSYTGSVFTNCMFSGRPTHAHHLLLVGQNVAVSRCLFLDCPPESWGAVWVASGNSRLDSNLFLGCRTRAHLVTLNVFCGDMFSVTGNQFVDVSPSDGYDSRGACVSAANIDSLNHPCIGVEFSGNLFLRGYNELGTKGVVYSGGVGFSHNRYDAMQPEDQPTNYALSSRSVFHENIFVGNGIAVDGDVTREIGAEWNYWGDSTGPYHPTLNPSGLGDEVGDFVDFDPWYTDTLFWNSSSPEPHPQLPNEVKLSVYPNPFNATTTLELYVPKAQIVEVKLYDLLGREVKQLFKGPAIDVKRIFVNADDFASGIYFARASDPIRKRSLAEVKMLLVK